MIGLKKIIKKNPLKDAVLNTPPNLVGGIFWFGRINCLSDDTKIFVIENNEIIKKRIDEIKGDCRILSYDFKNLKVVESIAKCVDSGEKECFEIEFDSGLKVVASADHKFFRKNGTEVCLRDLHKNNLLAWSPLLFKNIATKIELQKIKNVTKIGKRHTFDLVVPGLNNFFLANGVLSHNSGKSTGQRAFAEAMHDHPDRRCKIVGLWGGDRMEQLYWCLPSADKEYWKQIKSIFKMKQEGPKQYKVNLLYPMSNHLRKKLPNNPPYIHSKVFTIPISSIMVEDISLCLGNIANTHEYLWRESLEKLKKKQNGAYFIKHVKDLNGDKSTLYKNFILPLVNHKLLQSDYCNYNLDLITELKDRETITILCLDFIEKEFRLFVMGWILRQISVLIDNGRVPTRNIIMIQEAAEFFRATDDSIMPDRYKIFRSRLAHYIRMGRRGMHMFLDAQSVQEVRGLISGSEDMSIFGRLPGEADKEAATKQLYRDNLISKRQIQELSTVLPGECFIAEAGKKVKKRYLFLPRTMYWRKNYGNFYDNVWKNMVDEWRDVKPIIDELEEDFSSAKKAITEELRMKKELERLEKERKTREEETKRLRDIENREAEKRKAKARGRKNEEKTDLELTKDDVDEELEEQSINTDIDIINKIKPEVKRIKFRKPSFVAMNDIEF